MGLFTNFLDKIIGVFNESGYVKGVAVVLRNADDTHDVQQGDGLGGAKVSLSTASTAALASQTTLASVLAQILALYNSLLQPEKHTVLTPHDTTDITAIASKGLMIGGSGNLYYTLVSAPDTVVGPIPVQPGQFVPGRFAKLKTTGPTTATTIVGMS